MKIDLSFEFPSVGQYIDYYTKYKREPIFVISPVLEEMRAFLMSDSREVIVDNGAFELTKGEHEGPTLNALVRDYLSLRKRSGKTWYVAPDRMNDTLWSHTQLLNTLEAIPKEQVAAVVVGGSVREQIEYYQRVKRLDIKLVMFSFLSAPGVRVRVLRALSERKELGERVHLLGVKGLNELARCLRALKGVKRVSIDTSKPVKVYPLKPKDLNRGQHLRGARYLFPENVEENAKKMEWWIKWKLNEH